MSATGLPLGVITYLVIRRDDLSDRVGTNKTALAGTSLVLGIVALVLAETAAAEVLLAVFMASILIVWAIELMDHAGILPGAGRRIGLRYPEPASTSATAGVARSCLVVAPRHRCVRRLPAAMRGPWDLHSRPDEQPERRADDHAEGGLGAAANQRSEDNADRRAQCEPQSGYLGTSVGVANHRRPPFAASAPSEIDRMAAPR